MGRPRMPHALRLQMQELLLSGLLSSEEIAERLNVGRGTVFREKQALFEPDGGDACQHLAPDETYLTSPIRCPGCGGRIFILPCRLCIVRARLEADRSARVRGAVLSGPPERRVALKQQQLALDGLQATQPAFVPRSKRRRAINGAYTPLLNHFKKSG